jgi:hypothetical protein
VLPVRYQGPPQVRPRKDLEEGLLELLRVQAVQEEGEDGVARGLAQAQVRQEVGVGAGKSGYVPQGVHAGEEGHQDES